VLQRGAKLLCVSDLLLLGRATIEEARSLLHWLDYEKGFGKMGICGLSMGKACLNPCKELTIFMFTVLFNYYDLHSYSDFLLNYREVKFIA